jgi:hypothetical protein
MRFVLFILFWTFASPGLAVLKVLEMFKVAYCHSIQSLTLWSMFIAMFLWPFIGWFFYWLGCHIKVTWM